ncbi:Lysophospholipase 1 [Aspergillus tanneri]|uniref:Lysophospholipase n=1 Tax=Aspergillus tanneri TaxID=1220188 RepID=A0A5M9M7J6_9EURO|nr:Lysophospholipase 1 [Aspergillus tanneri]KAA8641294.1 Lysophospholipase 1 [Aspergillus tanneri]
MKIPLLSLAAAGLSSAASLPLDPRALPNAPDGYAPANVSCPATRPSIRSAGELSANETDWLKIRRKETLQPLKDLLGRLNIASFDAAKYIDTHSSNISNIPNVAIAVSGGGYRAMTNGAGALKAFDSRTDNSTAKGQLGGLLQSATYVSGLSGGSWLLGSIVVNNFTTVGALQADEKVWNLDKSIFEGPNYKGVQILSTASYWKHLIKAVDAKEEAGYNTSITDYWGRALSHHADRCPPLPLVVADGRNPGEKVIGTNSTVYEFNPWEFGTWDPSVYGFAPLEFLGSRFEDGKLADDEKCVRGFDNAGFVMGTSSSLFNQGLLRLNKTDAPDFVKDTMYKLLKSMDKNDEDIAVYSPNPFYRYRNATHIYAQQRDLDVVDGGEDGQNIPLHPVIQPSRHVDVVFAVDSSADTNSWPNGASLVHTYERSLNSTGIGNGTVFPAVPDKNTFINLGLNKRPTFFGCDTKNLTGPSPLIVYLPNSPHTYHSNASTYKMEYSDSERDDIILNGYNVVTRGNSSLDADWPSCVGCAIISRSAERTGTTLPKACETCFKNYCWNGTVDSREPKNYEPELQMEEAASSATRGHLNRYSALIAVSVAFLMTI